MRYEVFKNLNDLNPNFMKEIYYLSPYLTPRRSLRSFQKHINVWKQKLKVTWGTHMKLIALKKKKINIATQTKRYYEKVVRSSM